jgi:hypothetical protein
MFAVSRVLMPMGRVVVSLLSNGGGGGALIAAYDPTLCCVPRQEQVAQLRARPAM